MVAVSEVYDLQRRFLLSGLTVDVGDTRGASVTAIAVGLATLLAVSTGGAIRLGRTVADECSDGEAEEPSRPG